MRYNVIRIVATILVLVQHAAASVTVNYEGNNLFDWTCANFYDTFTRCCVPLFIILSGALLLDKDEPLKDFYTKRMQRVLIPALFWIPFYWLWRIFAGQENLSVSQIIYESIIGPVFSHLWYLYFIIPLYFVTPFIRKALKGLSLKDLEWMMILWFIYNCVKPNIMKHFGWDDLQYNAPLPTMTEYLGYYIAGYYWKKKEITRKMLPMAWGLYLSGTLLTGLGTQLLTMQNGHFYPYLFGYHSPTVFAQTFGLYFLLWIYSEKYTEQIERIFYKLSDISFGIYLAHLPIMITACSGALGFSFCIGNYPPIYSVPVLTIGAFVVSGTLIWLLRLTKLGRMIT